MENKKIKSVENPGVDVGIDQTDSFTLSLLDDATTGGYSYNDLQSFLNVSQRREELYQILDMMGYDSSVAAILETYSEDATEYNDNGRIVFATGTDDKAVKYVEFLLDSLQVDKNIYLWVHSLCKYGDLYLELFKQSEYDTALLFDEDKKTLTEDVIINQYKGNDKFVDFIEMVPNPAEMFELTQLGKTSAFIKAPTLKMMDNKDVLNRSTQFVYKYNRKDVEVFPPYKFVHASLQDSSSRYSEEVELFTTGKNKTSKKYKVKRGQSLLYNSFKIWRELSLLENSVLLNRITKSSIIRLINIEIADMSKEQVGPYLQRIKSMLEQKSSITAGQGIQEYTNPGPIENNVYIPSKDGKGVVTTSQIGGEVNISALPDLDYFQNKYFGALRIPKQYFGLTDDAAGFSGGESLAIISSRYAKMIKRIQSTIVQVITDAINLLLLDRGLNGYIGKFQIKMTPPTTKEEIDRREAESNKIRIVSDVMREIDGAVEDKEPKLRILNILLKDVVNDSEITQILNEVIEELEEQKTEETEKTMDESEAQESAALDLEDEGDSFNIDDELGLQDIDQDTQVEPETDEMILPTPAELDIGDLSDNTTEI